MSALARGFFETISNHFGDIQRVVINPFDPIRKMIRPEGRITRAEFEVRTGLPMAIPPEEESLF
jgi:hypothetical protein